MVEFEWDDDKRRSNVEKHGLDFRVSELLFDGRPRVTTESPWHDELRLVTTSEVDGVLYTVIWTDRIGKNSNHFPQVGA